MKDCKQKPVCTFEIHIDGYSPVLYSARTRGKARWRAFKDFGAVSTCDFGEFLARSSIRKVDDPPGIGARMLVCGKPATRVLGSSPGCMRYFMYDGSDAILIAHESDIRSMPGPPEQVYRCPVTPDLFQGATA